MRVFVTKPVQGRTNVRLDDHRGLTGMRLEQVGVPVADVGEVVGEMANQYAQRRKAIRDARKGVGSQG